MHQKKLSFLFLKITKDCGKLTLILLILFGWVELLSSQTRNDLEKQRNSIIKEIEKTSKELQQTKSDKEKNLSQLKAVEAQMQSRKKLISNLEWEVKLNERTLTENQQKLEELQSKATVIYKQYLVLVRANYLRKMAGSKWTYILSSQNLNTLLLRYRYMGQLKEYTDAKLKEFNEVQDQINQKNKEITLVTSKNKETISLTSQNVEVLQKEQKQKDELVKKLTNEEKKLSASLKKRERDRENLNAAIEKVILAELAKAKAKEDKDSKVAKKKEVDNSGFGKNKGALSFPVAKGNITGRFGTHPHPSIPNVQVSNNGVDFTLPSSSSVECVYDGEVVGVTTIPGFNTMIIVKHGSYYTVYSKLNNAVVGKGDKVKRGQTLGRVTTNEDGVTELHFELWKDKTKVNPEPWFRK